MEDGQYGQDEGGRSAGTMEPPLRRDNSWCVEKGGVFVGAEK